MSREVITTRDYSPQEFIDGLENLLLQPDEELPGYAQIDLVNHDQEVINPDGTHQLDELPFVRVSKELAGEDKDEDGGEVVYIVRRGSRPGPAYKTYQNNAPGNWRETAYTFRENKLYKRGRGQEQLNDGSSLSAIVSWGEEKEVSQEDLNNTHARLLASRFERRADYEARRLGARLRRLFNSK